MLHIGEEVLVVDGLLRVPAVLLAERDDHLVEQRVAQARDLHPWPGLRALVVGAVGDPHLAAAGCTPDAEHRLGAGHVFGNRVVGRQLADRDLDRDRVDVERLQGVHAGRHHRRNQVQVLERTQVGEVEDRPEVDEERIVALACEHRLPRRQGVDSGLGERRVVRRRARADVARRARQSAGEHLCLGLVGVPMSVFVSVRVAVPFAAVLAGGLRFLRLGLPVRRVDARHRVELALVPVRIAQRGDRARVVEEGVGVEQLLLKAELVRDLGQPVAVVVDVDRVENVVAELVEVRAACRSLGRYVVGDDRHRVRLVGADERIHVRVVGDWVLADLGRLSVRRHSRSSSSSVRGQRAASSRRLTSTGSL